MAEQDMAGFAKRMYVRADRTGRNIDAMMRKVALAVDQAVVFATPVDTGRARSNWVVGIDNPVHEMVYEFPEGDNGASALAKGAEVISRYGRGTRTIYISNNLPYIQRLNEGWSAQAPAGFVEEAVRAGARAVGEAKIVDES